MALLLHGRLHALLEKLDDEAGIRAYRRDLVAALILDAPTDTERLEEILRRYRVATAREALVGESDNVKVLEFHNRARFVGRIRRQARVVCVFLAGFGPGRDEELVAAK